jgi:hypothetical protein
MVTREILKSYLREMPRGHIFELTHTQFSGVFPPGEPDNGSRESLRLLAEECGCDIKNEVSENSSN